MNYVKRPLGLVFLTLMTLIAFEVATQKPLCLSSGIVNKIDRLPLPSGMLRPGQAVESIYACSSHQVPVFSPYFYENLREIESRLAKLEIQFSGLNLQLKVNIFIDERQKNINSINENTLTISPDVFSSKAFEASLLKMALDKRISFENRQLSELLAGALTGFQSHESLFADLWKKTYDQLGVYEKFRFNSSLRKQIAIVNEVSAESMTDSLMSFLNSDDKSLQNFKAILQSKLQTYGLINFEPEFDLVIETAPDVTVPVLKISEIAKKYSSQRVLLQTATGAFVLPYLAPLKPHEVFEVKTKSRILIIGQSEDAVDFKAYADKTESLIVMNSLGNEIDINFDPLFKSGVDKFLGANEKFAFIQFHLPSLIYRQDELKTVSNYFNFLKEASSGLIKEQGLGWASVSWSKDLQAYKPVAVYDVIQYYRLN